MQINVYPFPASVTEKQYFGKTAVVVDVLRSTTSMIEALQNGAQQIIPARDTGEAIALCTHLGRRESLLAGESGGLKLPGFDLGNSPYEFIRGSVGGKSIVFCTTNGTGAIYAARTAGHLLLGAIRNRTAVAKKALSYDEDIVIVCAGMDGECSIDDMIAAGGIYSAMLEELEETPVSNDFARICAFMYASWKRKELDMGTSAHYKHLVELGFSRDITYSLDEDRTDRVPVYENGSIR